MMILILNMAKVQVLNMDVERACWVSFDILVGMEVPTIVRYIHK